MTHDLTSEQQQQIREALSQFTDSVKRNPAIANCSMCEGTGTWGDPKIRYWQTCPRCEGSGKAGSFVVVLEGKS